MNAALSEATRLFRLAQRDGRAFASLVANTAPEDFPAAAFHAQQAVEKVLKAVLCATGIEYRRTHDLLELAGHLEDAGQVLPVAQEDLLRLTPYAVEFRYDDQVLPLISPSAAEQVVGRCLDWCASYLDKAR